MQAVAIDEQGAPRLVDLPVPAPGTGEMRLRLRWSGLCGTDLFKLAHRTAAAGSVLGHEIVGEVSAVGAGVQGFAPGDRVVTPHHLACGECPACRSGAETQCSAFRDNLLAPGGFAQEILVRQRAVRHSARRLPAALDDLEAIFLEPAACVLRSLSKGRILSAERRNGSDVPVVAIVGGGSMGLLHLLLLRALNDPVTVIVVDPRADRRALALELGADEAVAPGDTASVAIRESSPDGAGADAIFDSVGGSAVARSALAALRPGGTLVLFAHAGAGEPAGFELNDLFKHEKRIVGAYSGALAEQDAVWDLLVSGAFRPARLVTHRLPLADFARGLELARRQEALKVVFHP
ncbi:MAG: alcohol dehydrogenase catalytic domain-containing protein [Thermoanaerobaculia bacterium]